MEQESVGGRAPWPHLPRHTLHCGPAMGCSVGAAVERAPGDHDGNPAVDGRGTKWVRAAQGCGRKVRASYECRRADPWGACACAQVSMRACACACATSCAHHCTRSGRLQRTHTSRATRTSHLNTVPHVRSIGCCVHVLVQQGDPSLTTAVHRIPHLDEGVGGDTGRVEQPGTCEWSSKKQEIRGCVGLGKRGYAPITHPTQQ